LPARAGTRADASQGAEVRVLAEYFPVLLFMVVSAGIGIALILIGNVLGPRKHTAETESPYE
jgi:NADH-quinone oxidoreductase subunit A